MVTEDFVKALNIVAEVTEVDSRNILSSSKKMEYVEARILLCKVMSELGYHPSLIARKLKKTTNNIRLLIEAYSNREKSDKILVKMYAEITKKLSIN